MTGPGGILVAGGTGFIGSAVVRALSRHLPAPPAPLRALARRHPDPARTGPAAPGVEYLIADLTDPASLHGTCDQVDTLLHCASYVGPDDSACSAVNDTGTRALLDEAARAGVRRIIHISTTAVYGAGPHRGLPEDTRPPAPASEVSRTRLLAEQAVLGAAGTVLRPPFVYGRGDAWVVPAIAELLHRVPALPDGGTALISLVAVEDLARLVTSLALSPAPPPPGVHHAGHPEPVALRDLVTALARTAGLPLPTASLPTPEYLERLGRTPGAVSVRQARMMTEDRWYRSPLWESTGCSSGPGLAARLSGHGEWYRNVLSRTAPVPR